MPVGGVGAWGLGWSYVACLSLMQIRSPLGAGWDIKRLWHLSLICIWDCMWMVQNTQIFVPNTYIVLVPPWFRAGCLKWDFVGFLKCKLKRVLVAANCRPGVKPLTSWQPPLVSQKCLCSTRSNSSTQGDLGEVSIIIFGMSESSGFQKCRVSQALCLCFRLCHFICLCICVLLWLLNSFHNKLSEYIWL